VAELGGTLGPVEDVCKVSVVGCGMRTRTGVAEKMFAALCAEGVNMKMITTGDIKISVLIEEDEGEPGVLTPGFEADTPSGEPVKKAHLEARKAVRGRRALRAVHAAFELDKPRPGAGLPGGPSAAPFRDRPVPRLGGDGRDLVARLQLLSSMEDVVVSDVVLNTEQSRITIYDLPDEPGNCSRVFQAVATGGIIVDMIVQNLIGERAELSFSVPKGELTRALIRTQDVVRQIDPKARVAGDSDIAVLFVLGVGMRTHTGVARRMFGALAQRGINISMINTSEVCVSVVVERARGEEALAGLREAFQVK
jgi:aspartate kinase